MISCQFNPKRDLILLRPLLTLKIQAGKNADLHPYHNRMRALFYNFIVHFDESCIYFL